jgi:hypothetical protein
LKLGDSITGPVLLVGNPIAGHRIFRPLEGGASCRVGGNCGPVSLREGTIVPAEVAQVFPIEVEEVAVPCEKVAVKMNDLGMVDVDDSVIEEAVRGCRIGNGTELRGLVR